MLADFILMYLIHSTIGYFLLYDIYIEYKRKCKSKYPGLMHDLFILCPILMSFYFLNKYFNKIEKE